MIFTATISKQLSKDTVAVNCQDLNLVDAEAKISTCNGILPQYSINETVIIDLENHDSSKLIVLGSLLNKAQSSSISSSTLVVNSSVKSNNYPSVGQVSAQEFSCLQNLTTDLSQYFLRKDKENKNRANDLNYIETKINKLVSDTNLIVSNYSELKDEIEISDSSIGFLESQSEDDLCGKLNNSLKTLSDFNKKIGDTGKKSLKEYYDTNYTLASSFGITQPGNTTDISGMLQRAEEMVNYAWTAKSTFHLWNNSNTYIKGKQYTGVPYTLCYNCVDFDSFKKNKDNNIDSSVDGKVGPKYGISCAIFVSEILGINPIIATVTGLRDSGKLTKLNQDENKVSSIQPGDVLIILSADKGHCMWVGDVTDTTITIYEQSSVARQDANKLWKSGSVKRIVDKSSCTAPDGRYANLGDVNWSYDIYRPIDMTSDSNIGNDDGYDNADYALADKPTFVSIIKALKSKFPSGKYWNHAPRRGTGKRYNNQDHWTNTPCPVHGNCGTSTQTCNGFMPGDRELSWQCMGFAEKLGYDLTGYNPRSSPWKVEYTFKNIKPGAIVRIGGHHSIFVTKVFKNSSGERSLEYADCNSDGHCIIKWGKIATFTNTKITRSGWTESLTEIKIYTKNNYSKSPMLNKHGTNKPNKPGPKEEIK